ncbi:acyl carrier protein [Streptomyces albus subsp. chlorinus]|uniref:acyl carrier protein n=1 Tax=Streptomyces albus TaxID=1888 RepID=UPI00156DD0B5|nr:acyl carrier protein [Streptomyces albus]NSC19877.1 acyl carrier protein [Streptomyces albus subsp. chlorinus]
MDAVHDHVIAVLTDKFEVPSDTIRPGVSLSELGLDSLAVTELLVTLQEHYGTSAPDDAVSGEATPDDVVALVHELRDGTRQSDGQGTPE